jgi:hypothetical protein
MSAIARSKRAKRLNRKKWNKVDRDLALRLRIPQSIGLVAAAELMVDEIAAEREREQRPRQTTKRAIARQTPMERYLARNEVTRQQYDNAQRLWSDYMLSGLTATVTGRYSHGTGGGGGGQTPGCGARYAEYTAAMRAVGIILSPALSWVVLEGLAAGDWATRNKRPETDGIVALRLALDALGMHYRGERG